jgi:hypothetical protein
MTLLQPPLFIKNRTQIPIMILGTHQLTGKIETLKEPFCVMERRRRGSSSNGSATNMEFEDDYQNENQERSNQTSFHIVGVVRRKFLFNQYPKSIMR